MKPGDALNHRYELVERLGSGGMAEVWKASDRREPRLVAVKMLRSDQFLASYAGDDARHADLLMARRRFRREANLLKQLRHPGIPRQFDIGKHGDDPYLVMEYVDGGSLHQFLETNNPSISTIASIVVQVAAALDAVHALPVVHRDLKPHNILIAADGTVKLIDFGVAKILSPGATQYTRQGSTVGSRGYQAPEQILEEQVTPATDLYALGCIVYKMLTGRPPFEGDGLAKKHLHEAPAPPTVYNSRISADIEHLTLGMLGKRPEDRPESALAVLEVFTKYLPKPGDPAPSPRINPDPTAYFRNVRTSDTSQRAMPAAKQPSHPRAEGRQWLSKREVAASLARLGTDPVKLQEASAELCDLLAAAQRQWGVREQVVSTVRQQASDALRLAGDFGRAGALYQDTIDIAVAEFGEDHPDVWEGRLGLSECRIPFGDLQPAIGLLREMTELVRTLPEPPASHLAERAIAVAQSLREAGHTEAQTFIDALVDWRSASYRG
ncbi:serine/threonine-protein kinase [Micromonospora sp. NPDC048843]|uniref:serine/threonine-protein kinase n=1 Tax=Micromonospora sp. NPDC048843 TaxID=3155389 RepID=UPI0033CBAE47